MEIVIASVIGSVFAIIAAKILTDRKRQQTALKPIRVPVRAKR